MLTGFKNLKTEIKVKSKVEDKNKKKGLGQEIGRGQKALELLKEALQGALHENDNRVHIEGDSYIVDFKLAQGMDLRGLEKVLGEGKLEFLDSKIVGGEMLAHIFTVLPEMKIIEVWYKPYSRPRM